MGNFEFRTQNLLGKIGVRGRHFFTNKQNNFFDKHEKSRSSRGFRCTTKKC